MNILTAEEQQQQRPPRKAILSIDGGGVRGLLSLELLVRLESELSSLFPGTLLADHFDLIAGTSVGSIFAALIALRKPAAEIRAFIADHVRDMFRGAGGWRRLWYRYDKTFLQKNIIEMVGENTKLGDPRLLKPLLLLVMRNASTDSPWLVSSNPAAPFNRQSLEDCNLELPLWKLMRASAAAPSYFAPEVVTIGPRTFVFVDGALTGFNNPAFKSFQYVTTGAYGLNWPVGEDALSIVSIGTGIVRKRNLKLTPQNLHLAYLATSVPETLIGAADREQDVLCRTFGRCHYGHTIDMEIEDLGSTARTALEQRLFRYYRFNISLDRDSLAELGLNDIDPAKVSRIDAVNSVRELQSVGHALADKIMASGLDLGELVRARPSNVSPPVTS